MRIKNVDVEIVRGRVGDVRADAIVIPSDVRGSCGDGRGPGPFKDGEGMPCPLTLSPGTAAWRRDDVSGRVMIYAGVTDSGETNEHVVRQAVGAALSVTRSLLVDTVVFPSLIGDNAGLPLRGAIKILAQEILKFARTDPGQVTRIVVCPDRLEDDELYRHEMTAYITHIQENLGCGPYVTVDIIIERPEGIVFIERSNPPFGLALPGGFVDPGESLEDAARREALEETGLALEVLRKFHVYSAPDRDPRFHTVSTVFVARGCGTPRFGDDAKGLTVIPREAILSCALAFDHGRIMQDYLSGLY